MEKKFPLMVEHTRCRKFSEHSGERQNPKEFKEIWKDVSLRLILEKKGKGGYQFIGSNLGVKIFLKKREHHEKGVLK